MTSIWGTPDDFGIPDDKEPGKKPPGKKKGKSIVRDAYGHASYCDEPEEKWWQQPETPTSRGNTSQSSGFSYREAFDDSADNWYQKDSFRYKKYTDYSPSRLFRSSFYSTNSIGFVSSGSYAYGADNQLKNKAIAALRTLTRNANTVANKDAKITYSVKFSGGADSNGVADTLTAAGKKQRNQTIYVSPDDIAAAKTADDDDAAVDALTGFVLLRVQIAQCVPKEVIDDVNNTAMTALPKHLAAGLATGTLNAETAQLFATGYTDTYAAGILAKGLLTRMARRLVVEDWGGFAPYFVRHAKKFERVREKIDNVNGELSVEQLTAQIAYNLLADEAPIPIAAEVSAIIAKHLGEEVPVDRILVTCAKLVAELREYLKKLATDAGKKEEDKGQIEKALNELLAELTGGDDAAGRDPADAEKVKEALTELGGVFDDAFNAGDMARVTRSELTGKVEPLIAEASKLNTLSKMRDVVADCRRALAKTDAHYKPDAPVGDSEVETKKQLNLRKNAVDAAQYVQHTIQSQVEHFTRRCEVDLDAAGIKPGDLLQKNNPLDGSSDAKLRETITAHVNNLVEFDKKITKRIKDMAAHIQLSAVKTAADVAAKLSELAELERTATDKLAKTADKINSLAERHSALAPAADGITAIAASAIKAAAITTETQQELKELADKIPRMKSVNGVARAINNIKNATDISEYGVFNAVLTNPGRHAGPPMAVFTATAIKATNNERDYRIRVDRDPSAATKTPRPDWRPMAVDQYMAELKNSDAMDFKTTMMNAVHKELFAQLIKMITEKYKVGGDSSGHIPNSFKDLHEDLKDVVSKTAEALGMSPKELLSMLCKIHSSSGQGDDQAQKIGNKIQSMLIQPAKELSPTDDQLFGEQVKNTTTILTGDSLNGVNDEALNRAEEDFVAYLSHNSARPKVRIIKSKKNANHIKVAAQIRGRNRAAIDRVRSALQFQSNKRSGEVHGMVSGDLDEGSLHKLRYDSEHIWSQKTLTKLPDVAVGILVDQSGSMGSGSKIEQAQEMCIVLAEAIKQIGGVHLHIYGHTANNGSADDLQLFEHYSSYGDAKSADLGTLGGIRSLSNNYDGYAIKETAKLLDKDPAKKKYLFVIADGLPSGDGYGGDEATKHVTSVCSFVRTKMKIATYAFAVGQHHKSQQKTFEEQYGATNTVFISSVKQALPRIVRFLRNVLQKEKTLVEATID